ncbi:MAG: AAA family ATPase [Gemmatimonadota bacterium]|nr:AAA family ATPase [Gemmatimonadota bacterium]
MTFGEANSVMFEMFGSGEGQLTRLLRDLTAEARADRLEPVCCRDAEISRVVDILLRQSKNNPALVGPAGVGKTAIAEGLAQRIAAGQVPLALRSARVLALDHVALLAGTMFRGQYEERLRALIASVTADPSIVLFIDELHNLIGQGTSIGTAMDAANMLKPALVRGDFRVIGATTGGEYDKWVRGDPALERRFQKVVVAELNTEQSLEVLRSRRERMERHHNIAISEDAVLAAVRLSDLFITDRARPDRAIDMLDEACAHVQARVAYTTEAEALIVERRELLRRDVRVPAESGAATSARDPALEEDDPLGRFAREGIAALERFGLDLEAALAGRGPDPGRGAVPDAPPASPPDTSAADASAREPRRPTVDPRSRLTVVEWELQRRLIEEGAVVRGHDVARVVSAATGQRVEWKP